MLRKPVRELARKSEQQHERNGQHQADDAGSPFAQRVEPLLPAGELQ